MFWKTSTIGMVFLTVGISLAQEKKDPAENPTVQAVPDAEAQAKATKTIQEIFKAEYAKKKISDQVALSNKLLDQAAETNDDPASKFVLLREARDLACKAGDTALAMKVIDEMVKSFAVVPLEMKLSALDLAEKSSTAIATNKNIFESSVNCIDDAVAADNYEMADKFLKIAQAAVRKTRIVAHTAILANRTRELENTRKEYVKVKKDLETLKEKPNDLDANLHVGRFLCFYKGDWTAGLPLLANSGDTKLMALAKKDIDGPVEAPARVEVGDGWWDIGDGLDKAVQTELRLRAVSWYKQAVGEATGLTKARIEKRIAEMEKIIAARTGTLPPISNWTVLFRSADPSIWNKDVKKGRNQFAVSLSTAPEKMKYLKLTELKKNRYVIVELTKEQLDQRVEANGYGWIGTNFFDWKGYHLGIYNPEWKTNKGEIVLYSPSLFNGVRGWGFGSRHTLNDRQAWAWGGDELPAPTILEIAVKAGALSTEETKHLLKKKAKP